MLLKSQERVAKLVARGQTNKEIAKALELSVETVKEHVHGSLTRLGLWNRTQLAIWWVLREVAKEPLASARVRAVELELGLASEPREAA